MIRGYLSIRDVEELSIFNNFGTFLFILSSVFYTFENLSHIQGDDVSLKIFCQRIILLVPNFFQKNLFLQERMQKQSLYLFFRFAVI